MADQFRGLIVFFYKEKWALRSLRKFVQNLWPLAYKILWLSMQLRQTTIKRHLFLCTRFALLSWRVDLSEVCNMIRLIYLRLFLRWPRCYIPRRNLICIIHIWLHLLCRDRMIWCQICVLSIYWLLRWFIFLQLHIWVIIGDLSEFTNIGSSKKIILYKYVPQRTVVDLVVYNDLL